MVRGSRLLSNRHLITPYGVWNASWQGSSAHHGQHHWVRHHALLKTTSRTRPLLAIKEGMQWAVIVLHTTPLHSSLDLHYSSTLTLISPLSRTTLSLFP